MSLKFFFHDRRFAQFNVSSSTFTDFLNAQVKSDSVSHTMSNTSTSTLLPDASYYPFSTTSTLAIQTTTPGKTKTNQHMQIFTLYLIIIKKNLDKKQSAG